MKKKIEKVKSMIFENNLCDIVEILSCSMYCLGEIYKWCINENYIEAIKILSANYKNELLIDDSMITTVLRNKISSLQIIKIIVEKNLYENNSTFKNIDKSSRKLLQKIFDNACAEVNFSVAKWVESMYEEIIDEFECDNYFLCNVLTSGNIEFMEWIKEKITDYDLWEGAEDDNSPFHMACEYNFESAKWLYENYPLDTDSYSFDDNIQFSRALSNTISSNNFDAVLWILSLIPNGDSHTKYIDDDVWFSSFEFICSESDNTLEKKLVEINPILSIKINSDKNYLKNILFNMVRANKIDSLRWLIKTFSEECCQVDYKDLLVEACKRDYLIILKILLKHNKNIDISFDDEYLFRTACINSSITIVKWLLKIRPKLNIYALDNFVFRNMYKVKYCRDNSLSILKIIYDIDKSIVKSVDMYGMIKSAWPYCSVDIIKWSLDKANLINDIKNQPKLFIELCKNINKYIYHISNQNFEFAIKILTPDLETKRICLPLLCQDKKLLNSVKLLVNNNLTEYTELNINEALEKSCECYNYKVIKYLMSCGATCIRTRTHVTKIDSKLFEKMSYSYDGLCTLKILAKNGNFKNIKSSRIDDVIKKILNFDFRLAKYINSKYLRKLGLQKNFNTKSAKIIL